MTPTNTDAADATIVINYSVKELLTTMQESLARIDAKLDTKASMVAHEQLANRVALLELAKAKLYGGMAMIGFLSGGGGWLLAAMSTS